MKKSMIVLVVIGIVLSMNLFGEVVSEKTKKVEMMEKHECTADCNHEEGKKVDGKHVCSDKCEMAKKHVCTEECKLDEKTKTCELTAMKGNCMSSMKQVESVKDQGCKPVGCKTKVIDKDCKK